MYLTYDEYVNMGGTLTETAFSNLEFDAETVINWYTFDRLLSFTTIPQEVKSCMYRLIDILSIQDNIRSVSMTTDEAGKTTTYQSNDGVAIRYNVLSANELLSTSKQDKVNTIQRYLSNVKDSKGRKILYRGLYPDE